MINQKYAYHKTTPDTGDKITTLREAFQALDELVQEFTPPSRERSLALTELETAAMWAIKAVVLGDPKSEAVA